jgi:ferredoxin
MAMRARLRVNPILCTGYGMCAELLPERIAADDWGFPILDPRPVDGALRDHARRAVAACPTGALQIVAEPEA